MKLNYESPYKFREGFGVLTVKDFFLRSYDMFRDNVFARTRRPDGSYEESYYRDLYENAVSLGTALAAMGMKPGGRVAVAGENRFEWAVAYFAVLVGGSVCVPIDAHLKEKEIKEILERSETEVAIISPKLVSTYLGLAEKLPKLRQVISMGPAEDGALGWLDILKTGDDEKAREEYLSREVNLDDTAVLIFTSGTTGSSKAVILTHRNLGANANQVYTCLPFTGDDVFLSLLPLHHTFEAMTGMFAPMSVGCSITYARSFKSKEIIEDIRDTGVSVMCGVPLLYEKMLAGIFRAVNEKGGLTKVIFYSMLSLVRAVYFLTGQNIGFALFKGLRKKAGLDSLKLFVSGAAPLQPHISEKFYFLGLPLLQGYGLTEASPVVSVNPYNRIKFASSGPPIPGVEVRVNDPGADGEGEIIIRGDNVMEGYYRDPTATAETLRDNWLYTGDAGWIDRDGYLYITGRVKNVIVTPSGKNIHPEEVEADIAASPFVSEVMVCSITGKKSGREEVGAVIYPDFDYFEQFASANGAQLTDEYVEEKVRDEVNQACKSLADYKRVKVVKIRKEELPKTTTRKVKRYLFRNGEQIADG
ncbi:MAG: AMP-binding protein [Candidatus Coatesbacteria bacterium]|nr:MAG: AMP-binding protein [Candidatus Coatesbacteria bacterium]